MAAVVAAATAAWNAAVDQASQTYDAALSAAQAAWTEAEAAAWSQSTAATQAAFAAYRDILEDLQAQANAAWDDYQRTLQAAGGAGAGARYWSSPGLAGATGFCLGLGQGVVNIVNGVQDTVVGILNLPAMGINAIARAEEKAGILNPNDPLRVPYIPSPDWSRGLITDEAGTPGSWTDTHGWSKFFGATGVELIPGTWAAKAANKAREAVALVRAGTRASRLGINVETLELTQTVAGHLATRPYLRSRLLVREIIEAAEPTTDGIVSGAWRWEVPGSWNGKQGIYELVIDPNTNRILHFLWISL